MEKKLILGSFVFFLIITDKSDIRQGCSDGPDM